MKNDEQVFRVSNLFYYILRGRRLIIIFAIIGFIAGIILSGVAYLRGEMSKEYQITSSIAIIAQTRSGNYASNGSNPGSDDVKLAQEITDSAIYILRSDRTLRAAIEAAGLTGVSVADIKKNLQLSQYNETQIIEITLYWRSNTEGIRVLEAINQVSGEVLLETLKIGNVSVVNTPDAHYIVGGSVSMSTWVLGAFGGAAIAMGICILKLFLAPVLTHVKDVERFYTMKVLGSIPYDKKFPESIPFAADGTKAQKANISLAHILSSRMEAAERNKVIVTSSIHNEGRTTLSANIARHIADSGVKTLLVDCDFKNPRLSTMFDGQIPYENTLNAVYFGDADETDAIRHVTGCLDLLPAIISDEPISLNDAMLDVINKISENYGFVILDCAPIGMDAEVVKLKRVTDTVLLTLKFDYTELENVDETTKLMWESGFKTIGCAVTSVKTFRDILLEAQKISLFIKNPLKRAEKEAKKANKKAGKKDKKAKKSKRKSKKDRTSEAE